MQGDVDLSSEINNVRVCVYVARKGPGALDRSMASVHVDVAGVLDRVLIKMNRVLFPSTLLTTPRRSNSSFPSRTLGSHQGLIYPAT
jgi:hypothetical protein